MLFESVVLRVLFFFSSVVGVCLCVQLVGVFSFLFLCVCVLLSCDGRFVFCFNGSVCVISGVGVCFVSSVCVCVFNGLCV